MTIANIVFLIDIQNGFAKAGLSAEQGGSLYVPEGELVGAPAAEMITQMRHTVFVLSQDFHPANHISFASNHPGAAPLDTRYLKKGAGGAYVPAEDAAEGAFAQTLWPDHCVQGTESALFVHEIMDVLPKGLQDNLYNHVMNPVLIDFDNRGNAFYVIRKGMRSDLDSYGIATENDGISMTKAPVVFRTIARAMKKKGIKDVKASIGGLATNFCVEFSNADLFKALVPELTKRGIKTSVSFLADISRGVPIPVPGGAWPDLDAAPQRMAALGAAPKTSQEIVHAMMRAGTAPANNRAFHL